MSNFSATGLWKSFFLLFLFLILTVPISVASSPDESRSDIISIRLPNTADIQQMPDAIFLHDRHTQALKNKDCRECHLISNDILIFKFNRIQDAGYDADKKMYHKKCINCHQKKRDQGITSGPQTSECRLCHTQNPSYHSAAQPFGMDKSLHYRHIITDAIKPPTDNKDGNCGACHHEFDNNLNKTLYVKGKEGTCRYCHKAEMTDDTRSFKTVAHEDCLNCHYRFKSEKKEAGPTDCAACHDAGRQAKIETIADIPRIKRNQPDAVLLSLWLKEAVQSGEPSQQFIQPVAFDHKSHETNNGRCYFCHHKSMESCSSCHTRLGTEKSKYTRLGTAMHSAQSITSCIGCHKAKLQDKNCAGCHAQMSKKTFAESDCTKCHTIDKKAIDPLSKDDKKAMIIAESEIQSLKTHQPQILEKDIPENVTIDIMADLYEGATFPHRKIVQALSSRIQENELAIHFHGESKTMCTGCHHYSPPSLTPPKCASCHGISPVPEHDGRPGLKGAYHGQCIGCHQEMGIEKPAATDCISCHKLQTKSAQQSD